jgi:hypothetical protein
MSDAHEDLGHAEAHDHGVRSEDDHVPALRLALIGVAALVIFFLGSLAAVSYERMRRDERGPIVAPPEIGLSKIGLVEQQPFVKALRGEGQRAQQLERLGSYGWVDKKAGVAFIPIDEAMRLVAQGVRPPTAGGAPPPGGQP